MNNSQNLKICAIIPFYNEKGFIGKTVSETSKYIETIICIDDGSTDGSSEEIPLSPGIIILKNKSNSGKGSALKKGFYHAKFIGMDFVITLDADLQHPPSLIPLFIRELNNFDLILGNRMNSISGMPFHRVLSNKITSKLISLKTGADVKDSQCGFRAFRLNIVISKMPDADKFIFETEILIALLKIGIKYTDVEIPAIYNDNVSKMKSCKTIIDFLKLLFKL